LQTLCYCLQFVSWSVGDNTSRMMSTYTPKQPQINISRVCSIIGFVYHFWHFSVIIFNVQMSLCKKNFKENEEVAS